MANDDRGARTARRTGSDGPEPLLACGIPYLQLDPLAIELDGAYLEVDADRGDERRGERVVRETQEQAALADTFGRNGTIQREVGEGGCRRSLRQSGPSVGALSFLDSIRWRPDPRRRRRDDKLFERGHRDNTKRSICPPAHQNIRVRRHRGAEARVSPWARRRWLVTARGSPSRPSFLIAATGDLTGAGARGHDLLRHPHP
ncbi:MAG: hypothetical protein BJ554DRAFT_8164 [Olpidium bornovanus]|uniref:Uncharacterized protein n=1 Tax=Olpidium bornovanus TaxID=278681 RepID=A0A8H8DII1_9FUNG|nr:MAG: hypothetical protein BJ554DRAFT_8164 [Olpidium bornovanus]